MDTPPVRPRLLMDMDVEREGFHEDTRRLRVETFLHEGVAETTSREEAKSKKSPNKLEHRAFKEDAFTSFVVENMALRVGGRQLRHSSVNRKLYQYNEREFLRLFGEDTNDRKLSSTGTSTSLADNSHHGADKGARIVTDPDPNPEPPVKRKRGRPRKVRTETTEGNVGSSSKGGASPSASDGSGKRGRKKGQKSNVVGVVPAGSGSLGCAPGLEQRRKARRNRRRRELEAVIGAAAGIEVEQAAQLLAEEEDALRERAREQSYKQRVSTSAGHLDTTSYYLKTAAEEPLLTSEEEVRPQE